MKMRCGAAPRHDGAVFTPPPYSDHEYLIQSISSVTLTIPYSDSAAYVVSCPVVNPSTNPPLPRTTHHHDPPPPTSSTKLSLLYPPEFRCSHIKEFTCGSHPSKVITLTVRILALLYVISWFIAYFSP